MAKLIMAWVTGGIGTI